MPAEDFFADVGGFLAADDRDAALATARLCVRAFPESGRAWDLLGRVTNLTGFTERSWHCYERAVALGLGTDEELLVHRIWCYDLLPGQTRSGALELRRGWATTFGGAPAPRRRPDRPDPERPLRVGFSSKHLAMTSAEHNYLGVIVRAPEDAEVYVYSDTPPPARDRVTADLSAWAGSRWRDTSDLAHPEWAATVGADGVDVLIDCTGITLESRLAGFSLRPAPVQMTGWGNATGTGLSAMDWFLGDSVVGAEGLTERLAELPCALAYEPFTRWELPARERDGPFTYGCFQRANKINGPLLELWGEILRRAPETMLILKDVAYDKSALLRQWIGTRLEAAGVTPERIVFEGGTPQAEHVARYGAIDLVLDSFPQTGSVTTMEALYHGAPVLSLLGQTIVSRLGGSILYALGLSPLVARTPREYVELAVAAATEPSLRAWLASLRPGLRGRFEDSPIGAEHYAKAVWSTIRDCWRETCRWAS